MNVVTPPRPGQASTPDGAPKGRKLTKYTILLDEDVRAYRRRLRSRVDVNFSDFLRALLARVAKDEALEQQILLDLGLVPSPGHDDSAPGASTDGEPDLVDITPPSDDDGFWDV